MQKIKISCIVPAYNEEQNISKVLEVITNLMDGILLSIWLNIKNIDLVPDKWAQKYQSRLEYLRNWVKIKKQYFKTKKAI